MTRTLLAGALAAAAFATAAPAQATTHPPCAFHPICDKIDAILHGASVKVTTEESHTICHRIEERAPWLVYCHD